LFDLALCINQIKVRDAGDIVIPEQIKGKPAKVHLLINNSVSRHKQAQNTALLTNVVIFSATINKIKLRDDGDILLANLDGTETQTCE
jgi:hypothetical protein